MANTYHFYYDANGQYIVGLVYHVPVTRVNPNPVPGMSLSMVDLTDNPTLAEAVHGDLGGYYHHPTNGPTPKTVLTLSGPTTVTAGANADFAVSGVSDSDAEFHVMHPLGSTMMGSIPYHEPPTVTKVPVTSGLASFTWSQVCSCNTMGVHQVRVITKTGRSNVLDITIS